MDDVLEQLGVPFERDAPLGPRTWFRVGGAAQWLARPTSVDQLSKLLAACHQRNVAARVLGSGANLLVRDGGVEGVVVTLEAPAFRLLEIRSGEVRVGGGYDLMKLVQATARAGLAGLEPMAGIPATVGGAIRMNAGGRYGEIRDALHGVQLVDMTGQIITAAPEELAFSYRRSAVGDRVVVEASFALTPDQPEAVRARVKEIFDAKKRSQPMGDRSAGCAFKNPSADQVPEGLPISAGALIDQAGLKGHRVGGAEVSSVHANFMVVDDGAKADDVLGLIESVQREVADRLGVTLAREVVVWP